MVIDVFGVIAIDTAIFFIQVYPIGFIILSLRIFALNNFFLNLNVNTIVSIHDEKAIRARENCLICVLNLLHSLNLHTNSNLHAAIEYVLTLSMTQVNCKRVFSKLKMTKINYALQYLMTA